MMVVVKKMVKVWWTDGEEKWTEEGGRGVEMGAGFVKSSGQGRAGSKARRVTQSLPVPVAFNEARQRTCYPGLAFCP